MASSRKKLVLFLGSGFSAELGLPTTEELRQIMLEPIGAITPEEMLQETFVSERIQEFGAKVFGWAPGAQKPSLEDHFTQIDLAANAGHCLGPEYGPRELRAIRRMTIHRIFEVLRRDCSGKAEVDGFIQEVAAHFDLTVVTTNWDMLIENCLERQRIGHSHGTGLFGYTGELLEFTGIPVLKLHGSLHLGYCDCCRAVVDILDLYHGLKLYLDPNDVKLFAGGDRIAETLPPSALKQCFTCNRVWSGGRIATFVPETVGAVNPRAGTIVARFTF